MRARRLSTATRRLGGQFALNSRARGVASKTSVRALLAVALLGAVFTFSGAPAGQRASAASGCSALPGSSFEIDADANLKVDGMSPCIDWLADGTGSVLREHVLSKNDKLSGSGDDSFGMGTSEDEANPTIVNGSIPPNKSDLKTFGVYTEDAGTSGKFLELFWSRVQNPSGTTNMDFELNQKFCDPAATPTNCANNGKGVTPETPVRTAGDKLITYDLAKGGTVPTISIRTWTVGSAWGPAIVLTGGMGEALGSVNTSTIGTADSDGIGPLSPFTFGEAAISFDALFPGETCGAFGSAYLKSRSSDSFTAELKDFIGPEQVRISNCATTLTTKATGSATVGSPISDIATLSGASSTAGGTITFHVFLNDCQHEVSNTGLVPVPVHGSNSYGSGNFTPTQAGTYYWSASYSGDPGNSPASSPCGVDPSETSVVSRKTLSVGTKLSSSLIGVGQLANDQATLTVAPGDPVPGGTVAYAVYRDAGCTSLFASAGTKTVGTNGVVPPSDSVTFNTAGTYYWQASYSGDGRYEPAKSDCTSEKMTVIGPCVLGYPSGSPPALSSVVFNESEVLRTFAAVPGGGSVAGPNDKIAVWYNDEHAITLGVRRVVVKTSAGTTPTDYTSFRAMTKNPDSALNPDVGTRALSGDQAGTDLATWNSTYGFMDRGRPMWPALFKTDITDNPNDRSGDWQQGGTDALPPNDIFGTWKGAVRTVDKTHTPAGIAVTPDVDPAKNNWNLGGGSDTPPGGFASLKQEGYGAEVRWHVSQLGLQSGHAYRLQFMVHDGDQNKTGGDSGEACMNVIIPG